METTLLYILHWILLDAAEECAETDADPGNPFYYLFSIPTMSVSDLHWTKENNNLIVSHIFSSYSCSFIFLHRCVIIWKILTLKQIYVWKMVWKYGRLCTNVVTQIHLASLPTVELNHRLYGVVLSNITSNIKCQMMCLSEEVSEQHNVTIYIQQ